MHHCDYENIKLYFKFYITYKKIQNINYQYYILKTIYIIQKYYIAHHIHTTKLHNTLGKSH